MLFRTHLVVPIFFILLFFQPEQITVSFFLVAVLASVFPDIDSPFSKIGKKFKILNLFMKHRGAIHSFSFIFLFGIFLFFLAREFLVPFVFGYSFHLILDGITIHGIRPLYPFKFRINGFIKTGKLFENIIFVFFLAGDLFLVFKLF